MDVQIAADSDREKWNQFVDREGGSFFQYYDWKFVYELKGRNHYLPLLIRDRNSDITAIFPLVEQKYLIYPWLSSLPPGTSGGFLLSNSLSNDEKNMHLKLFFEFIDKKFSQMYSRLTIKEQFQFNNGSIAPSRILLENGYQWQDNPLMCAYVLHLEKPFKEKIFNSFSRSMRNRIRHTKKYGADVIIDDNFTYFDDFAKMHIEMVKKFGLDSKKEDYNQILKIFQKKLKLFVYFVDSELITALLCYYTPTTVYAAMGPYRPSARAYLNNVLPVCTAIRDACELGYQYFDLGITHTSDLTIYKEKFGAKRIPMRIYTKKFSYFKETTNKSYQYFRWGRKKLVGSQK